MNIDELQEKSDKMFHDHGDILIKVFSVLVAFILLALWFASTVRPQDFAPTDIQQQNS
ncbi:MAG: hypothetical protein Q7S01_01145 [bacterium]|nr:hypothetical protein [bacterium]